MNSMKILLLSLSGADGLTAALRQILDKAEGARFQLIAEGMSSAEEHYARVLANLLARVQPNLVLLCLPRNTLRQAELIFSAIDQTTPKAPVVAICEQGEPEEIKRVLNLGAADFILAPFRPEDVLPRLCRLSDFALQAHAVARDLKEKFGLRELLLGESPLLTDQIGKIPKVARCDASVLICGETGTGKELFARAIHHLSPRSGKPFLPINCGAVPAELMENELFGHERGAFTGAHSAVAGMVHEADGGTLLLDEIDSLPLQSQVKLLRFLQDKEYRPLGSPKSLKADVRIIAASNADFPEFMRSGRFRSDLFYRLSVVTFSLPPLRRRKGDIPLLTRAFIAKHVMPSAKPAKTLSEAAMQKLLAHDWPGNVRELENIIERAVILSDHQTIEAEDIPLPTAPPADTESSFKALKTKVVEAFERTYVQQLLFAHDGNITQAAKSAQKNRRAFWELMRKYQIEARTQPAARRPR
jgi:DNA-binding NtrC family response regulator